MRWTAEAKATVAERLRAGDSAAKIGALVGVSRNAITGLLARDKDLAAIGFARKGISRNGGKTKRFSDEEMLERKRQYNRAYKANQRAGAIVIPFPKPTKALSANSPQYAMAKAPVLRVVSNNVPLMVEDWLAKNGGPRIFQRGETADVWAIRQFLSDRGIKTNGHRGKWSITRGPGRPKLGTWADIMAVVDDIRLAEGLQPFAARAPGREALSRKAAHQ